MPRLIMISPEEGAEALAKLEEAAADFAARARKAGKVIHQMLTKAVEHALAQGKSPVIALKSNGGDH